MTPERAELDVAGVGVRVEVDHRHPTRADHVRTALGVGVGDRVVPTQGKRYRPGPGDLLDRGLERRKGDLDVAGVHLHITGVVDLRGPARPSVRRASEGRDPSCGR